MRHRRERDADEYSHEICTFHVRVHYSDSDAYTHLVKDGVTESPHKAGTTERPVLQKFAAGLAIMRHSLLFILFIILPVLGLSNRYLSRKLWHLLWFTGSVTALPIRHWRNR